MTRKNELNKHESNQLKKKDKPYGRCEKKPKGEINKNQGTLNKTVMKMKINRRWKQERN